MIIRTMVTKSIIDTDIASDPTRNDDDDNDKDYESDDNIDDAVNVNGNSTPSLPYTSSIAPAA